MMLIGSLTWLVFEEQKMQLETFIRLVIFFIFGLGGFLFWMYKPTVASAKKRKRIQQEQKEKKDRRERSRSTRAEYF